MFTGLIEEKGKIVSIVKKDEGLAIKIKVDEITEKIKIGDSIAVNGVCLTVTSFNRDTFTADVMYETIKKSGLKNANIGDEVNIEKSLTLTSFLGGHLVMGDIDCEAEILSIEKKGIAKLYSFKLEEKYKDNMKYIVEKGRVTIDGASLTVIDVDDKEGTFSVSLIPHTLKNIILGNKRSGEYVNIETDLIGKYVEKILKFNTENTMDTMKRESKFTLEFLRSNGF